MRVFRGCGSARLGRVMLAVVMLAVGIGIGTGAMVVAQSTSEVYYACVNPNSGSIKMVDAATTCKKHEMKIDWNQTGSQGQQGIQGPQGEVGPVGPVGPEGPQGSAGNDGAVGPAGPEGPAGPQGATGPAGPANLSALEGTTCEVNGQASTISVNIASTGVVAIVCEPVVQIDLSLCTQSSGSSTAYGLCYSLSGFVAGEQVTIDPISFGNSSNTTVVTTDNAGRSSGFIGTGIPCAVRGETVRVSWADGALSQDISVENLGCSAY